MENVDVQTASADILDTPVTDPVSTAHSATIDRDHRETIGSVRLDDPRTRCNDVNVYYKGERAINNVSLDIGNNEVIALIGPSGCGKSTFLRCLNRMNDTIVSCQVTGEIM